MQPILGLLFYMSGRQDAKQTRLLSLQGQTGQNGMRETCQFQRIVSCYMERPAATNGKKISDKDLYLTGKEDDLYLRCESRHAAEIQDICKRLVGMGRCNDVCPSACPEVNNVGLDLFRQKFREALDKERFGPSGFLKIVILDDDFRRLWNAERGIVPKVLTNKLLRGGKPTMYGTRFAEAMDAHATLNFMGFDLATRLLSAESWLRNLWDDACDNAEMDIAVHQGSSESTYRHPSRFEIDSVFRRYGYRADRILRRRMNGEHEMNIDKNLHESIRPGKGDNDACARIVAIIDGLFETMELVEKTLEVYQDAPQTLAADTMVLQNLNNLKVSHQVDKSRLLLSRDDMDRFDDGVVDIKNPYIIYDDFYDAWFKTRRSDGLREISLNSAAGINLEDTLTAPPVD